MKLWNNPETVRSLLKSIRSSGEGWKADDLADVNAGGGGLFHPTDDLRQLVQWGLVDAQDKNKRSVEFSNISDVNMRDLTFRLSNNAIEIEDVLEINLTSSPFFGRAQRKRVRGDLFMLMPFKEELKIVFDTAVKNASTALKLEAARADASSSSQAIISQVWSGIYHAKVIVADCTLMNPNVLYEIGIAHALGRETVLISQTPQSLPFDIAHLRILAYINTPEGLVRLEEDLKRVLGEVLSLDKITRG